MRVNGLFQNEGELSDVRVTLGITTYEASDYVERCIKSIADQQNFPLEEMEVLIVDDGSSDDTVEKARKAIQELGLNGRVLEQQNTGSPSTGRNRILDSANGEFLFYIDVDDYLGEHAISSMVELADVDKADVVLGKFKGINRGVPRVLFRKTLSRTDIESSPLVDSLNVLKMFRTEYARGLGYRFNPTISMAEDHPFALSAYTQTDRVAIQSDVDCYYCVRHLSEKSKAQHLTGHILPVDKFYRYFDETFEMLNRLDPASTPLLETARGKYWHRLLYLDIPNEFRRARTPDDFHYSLLVASKKAEKYSAAKYTEYYSHGTRAMLRALELKDDVMAKNLARIL